MKCCVVLRKKVVWWFVLQGKLATSFMKDHFYLFTFIFLINLFLKHHFYLKEQLINYGDLAFGIWQTFFWKMNQVSLSLQRKQLIVFVAKITYCQQAEYRSIYEKPAVFYCQTLKRFAKNIKYHFPHYIFEVIFHKKCLW